MLCAGCLAPGGMHDLATTFGDASVDSATAPGSQGDMAFITRTCGDPTLFFCEDFETIAPGLLGSKLVSPNWGFIQEAIGVLAVDGQHAMGQNALHITAEPGGSAYIEPNNFAPPNNSFFGRMRVWMTVFPTAPDNAHFTMVQAAGSPNPTLIRPVGGQFISQTTNADLWGVGTDQGPTGDWLTTVPTPTASAAQGQWVCMEWQVLSSNNEIDMWINGTDTNVKVDTKTHGGTQSADFVFPTFNSMWIGWWLYDTTATPEQYDLWLDDIALSTTRIGC